VVANCNVEAALSGIDTALLQHAVVVAAHFIPAGINVARSPYAEGKTAACAEAGLLRVVAVAVLQAGYRQIAPDICFYTVTIYLRAAEGGIAPAGEGYVTSAVQRGFMPDGAVALFMTFSAVDAGKDAEACAA